MGSVLGVLLGGVVCSWGASTWSSWIDLVLRLIILVYNTDLDVDSEAGLDVDINPLPDPAMIWQGGKIPLDEKSSIFTSWKVFNVMVNDLST